MHSESEYPQQIQDNYGQAAELSDNSLAIEYQHNDRNWDWRFGHYDWGKDFRADLGFINRVDYLSGCNHRAYLVVERRQLLQPHSLCR